MRRPKQQKAPPMPTPAAPAPPPTPVARRPLARLGTPNEVLTFGSMGLGSPTLGKKKSSSGARVQSRKKLGGGSGLGYG